MNGLKVFAKVLFVLCIVFRYLLIQTAGYPLFIQFQFVPGMLYNIVSNASCISVQSEVHMALYYHIPLECDHRALRAFKRSPYIMLRLECEPKTIFYIRSIVDKSSTNSHHDHSFSI